MRLLCSYEPMDDIVRGMPFPDNFDDLAVMQGFVPLGTSTPDIARSVLDPKGPAQLSLSARQQCSRPGVHAPCLLVALPSYADVCRAVLLVLLLGSPGSCEMAIHKRDAAACPAAG